MFKRVKYIKFWYIQLLLRTITGTYNYRYIQLPVHTITGTYNFRYIQLPVHKLLVHKLPVRTTGT